MWRRGLNVWGLVGLVGLVTAQVTCPAYMCKPDTLPMARSTCVYYADQTYYLQVCDFGYYCNISPFPGNSTCEWPPQPINPPVVNWVGEFCNYMTFCKYGNCFEGLCRGLALDQPCDSNADCDIGLYCKADICTEQIQVGGTGCEFDTDCVNSAGCNSGTCAAYFSLEAGASVSSCYGNINRLCESSYCLDGHCLPSLHSENDLSSPCTSNTDCVSSSSKYGSITSNCTCGRNPEGSSFCSPFLNDSPGKHYLSQLKSWTQSDQILLCNTERRFDYSCFQSHMSVEDLREFEYYADLLALYPLFQQADNCTWFLYFVGAQDVREDFVTAKTLLLSLLIFLFPA